MSRKEKIDAARFEFERSHFHKDSRGNKVPVSISSQCFELINLLTSSMVEEHHHPKSASDAGDRKKKADKIVDDLPVLLERAWRLYGQQDHLTIWAVMALLESDYFVSKYNPISPF